MTGLQISVVIPAYNRAETVGRAIDSVLRQTYAPLEIIIIDDGSKDDTAAVIKRYGEPIRYFYQENGGVSAARNHGIRVARGDWIAFLDSDDEWRADKLEKQVAALSARPHLNWCCCNSQRIVGGRPIVHRVGAANLTDLRTRGYFRSLFVAAARGAWFSTCGMLIRRSVFEEVGFLDESLVRSEDLDLWWRIAMRHPAIGYVPAPLFRVHVGSDNSLVTTADVTKTTCLRALRMNMERAKRVSPQLARAFRRFGWPQVMTYILKTAAGEAKLTTADVEEALACFEAGPVDRWLARLCYRLPYKPARALRRIQEELWQPMSHRLAW